MSSQTHEENDRMTRCVLHELLSQRKKITDHLLHGNGTAVLLRQHADVYLAVNSLLHARVDLYAALNLLGYQRHSEVQREFEGRMGVDTVDFLMSHRHRALKESRRQFSLSVIFIVCRVFVYRARRECLFPRKSG